MTNIVSKVLRELEWSRIYSYYTGCPSCPSCYGIKPGFGKDEHGDLPNNSGHRADCKLVEALGAVEK